MFNLFDKLLGFFDKRFIIAYWAPVAIGLLGLAMIVALDAGLTDLLKQLAKVDPVGKVVLATVVVVTITVFAFAMQALTGSVIRLYEGYSLPRWLARVMQRAEKAKLSAYLLREEIRANETGSVIKLQERYFYFPPYEDKVRATRLGNAMTAAEEYPRQVYGLDSVLWWPRLSGVLPENLQNQVDGTLVPMISLLNMCTAFVLLAFGGAAYLGVVNSDPVLFAVPLWGGLLLARICYRAAVSQAVSYGNVVRVAYDFHRHEILTKMKLISPESLEEELAIWTVLNRWIYYYDPPWIVNPFENIENMKKLFDRPFRYVPAATETSGEATAPGAPGATAAPPSLSTAPTPQRARRSRPIRRSDGHHD